MHGKHLVGQEADLLQQVDDVPAVVPQAHLVIHFGFLQMHGVSDVFAQAILQHGLIAFLRRGPRHVGAGPDRQHVVLPVTLFERLHLAHGFFSGLDEDGRHAVFFPGVLERPYEYAADARRPHPLDARMGKPGILIRVEEFAEGRAAAFQRLHAGELRGQFMLAWSHDPAIGQRGQVQPFDQAVVRAQALQERLEDVNVGIDESGEENHAFRVDHLTGGMRFRQVRRLDPRDSVLLDSNRAAVASYGSRRFG